MLYLIRLDDTTEWVGEIRYALFETHTESVISESKEFVIKLIEKYNMRAKNFSIKNGQIELNKWPHKIRLTSKLGKNVMYKYTLLVNKGEQQFKLVNHAGYVAYKTSEELRTLIRKSMISNCDLLSGSNEFKSIDTYTIKDEPCFIQHIVSKYEEFRAKALIVGLDISFDYIKDVH